MSENNYSVKTTEELQEIVDMIQQILEERSEAVPDVAVGDTVQKLISGQRLLVLPLKGFIKLP